MVPKMQILQNNAYYTNTLNEWAVIGKHLYGVPHIVGP